MFRFELVLTPQCDSCHTEAPSVTVRLTPYVFRKAAEGDLRFSETDLPVLWEYHLSSGWGSAGYTKTHLLCGDCVRKWRDESVLDQIVRRVYES